MRKAGIVGALLLVVGVLAGGGLIKVAEAQHWPIVWDDLYLDADRYVSFDQNNPYTVPAGWVLLVQGLGIHNGGNFVKITVDGQDAFGCQVYEPQEIVPGIVAKAGQVVRVVAISQQPFAVGKLYRPK